MKILIAGTHFTTALATIEELKKYFGVEITYVGRKTTREGDPSKSSESEILPKLGIKFIPIKAGRLQRVFTIYTIPSLFKIPFGFIQAFFILMQEKPDVILSFGGYVVVPIVVWGWLLSIPIIIHEQTLVTGLANKISSYFAYKIAVSFKTDRDFDESKVILTGNPIRSEITQAVSNSQKNKLPVILITGGNQGSHVINLAVEDCLEKLLKIAYVIHQTGDSKFGDYERLERQQNDRYMVQKWITDMGKVLKKADLVIGRAGINTLTEIAYLGLPAIVIPIPYLYADEQNKNAKFFEKLGLVKILDQTNLNSETLFKKIKLALNDLNKLRKHAKNAKKIIIPGAAKRLATESILLGLQKI